MRLRTDFTKTECITPRDYAWMPTPEPGVSRMMLDRDGDEIAVATTIVRFDASAQFAWHEHDKGEEFLVLDGVFADEFASYPRHTYVRNPNGTAHHPSCPDGALLFVKLRQFEDADQHQFARLLAQESDSVLLHEFGDETVEWRHDAIERDGSAQAVWEMLVVAGEVAHDGSRLPAGSWLRLALGEQLKLSVPSEATYYLKRRPVSGPAIGAASRER